MPQASKVEDCEYADYEEEIKQRFKTVFIPNWFTVDLKTGVGGTQDIFKQEFSLTICLRQFFKAFA